MGLNVARDMPNLHSLVTRTCERGVNNRIGHSEYGDFDACWSTASLRGDESALSHQAELQLLCTIYSSLFQDPNVNCKQRVYPLITISKAKFQSNRFR